jgi:hypothetical protein
MMKAKAEEEEEVGKMLFIKWFSLFYVSKTIPAGTREAPWRI